MGFLAQERGDTELRSMKLVKTLKSYLKMEVPFELKMYFISRKKVFLDLPIGKEITNLVAMSTSDSQTTVSKYYFSQNEGRDGKKEENERGRKANPLHGEMTDSSSDTGNV